jgi:hypothetical protein
MACPQLYACGLHRNPSMKDALCVWRGFYCEGCFERCERFKLARTGNEIPETLLPNGRLVEGVEPAPLALDRR